MTDGHVTTTQAVSIVMPPDTPGGTPVVLSSGKPISSLAVLSVLPDFRLHGLIARKFLPTI
jgi:hypothetical protein